MSTGNTGRCIRSILWKPYRVRRRKRTPERTPGRTAGGADADGKRSRSTERNLETGNNRIYGFGMAVPSLFVSVVPTFFIHGKLFFIMKNAPRGSQSLSRRSEGTASVWKMSPVWPPQAENPGPLPRLLRRAGGASASGGGLWASVRNILLFHSIHKEIAKKT